MDGAHATDFVKADRRRCRRIEFELRDIMAANGIRLEDISRSNYNFGVSDWTWQKLAEDLAERIDRGRLT